MLTELKTEHLGLKLSVKEAELFCSLDFSNSATALQLEQKALKKTLGKTYEIGSDDINRKPWKAAKYLTNAYGSTAPSVGFWSTETALIFLGLYNNLRSELSSLNRILSLKYIKKNFLPPLFAIAGFTYFIDFGIDLYCVIKASYKAMIPLSSQEMGKLNSLERTANRIKEFWRCLKNTFREETNLGSRMLNTVIKGSVNMIFFFLNPPFALVVNLCLNSFDMMREEHRYKDTLAPYKSLSKKLHGKHASSASVNEKNYIRGALHKIRDHKKATLNDLHGDMLCAIAMVIGGILILLPGVNIAFIIIGASLLLAINTYRLASRIVRLYEHIKNSIHHTKPLPGNTIINRTLSREKTDTQTCEIATHNNTDKMIEEKLKKSPSISDGLEDLSESELSYLKKPNNGQQYTFFYDLKAAIKIKSKSNHISTNGTTPSPSSPDEDKSSPTTFAPTRNSA